MSPTAPSPTTDHGRTRLHPRRVRRVPARAQHVRGRKQARDQIVRRHFVGGTSVPSASGTRASGACAPVMNSRCSHDDWKPCRQCGQVLSEMHEGADDELARPDGLDRAADLDNHAAIFVSHGVGRLTR